MTIGELISQLRIYTAEKGSFDTPVMVRVYSDGEMILKETCEVSILSVHPRGAVLIE